jgi:hypothetical protein
MVVVLVVILAVLVGVGWSLRPQSSGFPTVPENVSLQAEANGVRTVSEALHRTADNGAVLEVNVENALGTMSGPWTLVIGNLGGGKICTPLRFTVGGNGGGAIATELLAPYRIVHPPNTYIGDGPPKVLTDVTSHGNFYVRMCWSSNAPVSLNGSYLSAQFPPVSSSSGSVSVNRVLDPAAGDTANFVIQSQTAPTHSDSSSWSWSGPGIREPVHLSAVNVSGTQHDSFLAFLSGITLGIAGGALIAILQEFVAPLSRRRDSRHPV